MPQDQALDASGLERDCRQDEFPMWQDELPARQDEFPTAYNHSGQNSGQSLHHGDPPVISETHSATKPRSRVCGLRKSTLWLVVIVIVLLVFTGIGAGVLGSKIKGSEKTSSNPSQSLSAFPSSTSTSATSSPISSSSTEAPVVKDLEVPDNDCKAVGRQYTIRFIEGKFINAQFNISCNADFGGGDFMSFYSPSLTTCMQGCAAFNFWQTTSKNHPELNCSGVTYEPKMSEKGNCWLKSSDYTTAITSKQDNAYAKLSYVK